MTSSSSDDEWDDWSDDESADPFAWPLVFAAGGAEAALGSGWIGLSAVDAVATRSLREEVVRLAGPYLDDDAKNDVAAAGEWGGLSFVLHARIVRLVCGRTPEAVEATNARARAAGYRSSVGFGNVDLWGTEEFHPRLLVHAVASVGAVTAHAPAAPDPADPLGWPVVFAVAGQEAVIPGYPTLGPLLQDVAPLDHPATKKLRNQVIALAPGHLQSGADVTSDGRWSGLRFVLHQQTVQLVNAVSSDVIEAWNQHNLAEGHDTGVEFAGVRLWGPMAHKAKLMPAVFSLVGTEIFRPGQQGGGFPGGADDPRGWPVAFEVNGSRSELDGCPAFGDLVAKLTEHDSVTAGVLLEAALDLAVTHVATGADVGSALDWGGLSVTLHERSVLLTCTVTAETIAQRNREALAAGATTARLFGSVLLIGVSGGDHHPNVLLALFDLAGTEVTGPDDWPVRFGAGEDYAEIPGYPAFGPLAEYLGTHDREAAAALRLEAWNLAPEHLATGQEPAAPPAWDGVTFTLRGQAVLLRCAVPAETVAAVNEEARREGELLRIEFGDHVLVGPRFHPPLLRVLFALVGEEVYGEAAGNPQ